MRHAIRLSTLLCAVVALTGLAPATARAASLVDGYVWWYADGSMGAAVGATVEVVQTSGFAYPGYPVVRYRTTAYNTGSAGAYFRTASLYAGTYQVRATYAYRDRYGRVRTLQGQNCCVVISGTSWPSGFTARLNVNVQ